MKKHYRRRKKDQSKLIDTVFIGLLAGTVILVIALMITNAVAPDSTEYIITADGHIHTADGAHVGDAADLFGSDYTVTEDGHVHAADGTHLGTYSGE